MVKNPFQAYTGNPAAKGTTPHPPPPAETPIPEYPTSYQLRHCQLSVLRHLLVYKKTPFPVINNADSSRVIHLKRYIVA